MAAIDEVPARLTFSVPETARLLGLSKSSTYRAVQAGDIPTVRVRGRLLVPRAQLMKMLEAKEERMVDDNIDEEVAQALDERVAWIAQAFGALREQGPTALGPLIDQIPEEHLRSVVFVLLLQREQDYKNVKDAFSRLN